MLSSRVAYVCTIVIQPIVKMTSTLLSFFLHHPSDFPHWNSLLSTVSFRRFFFRFSNTFKQFLFLLILIWVISLLTTFPSLPFSLLLYSLIIYIKIFLSFRSIHLLSHIFSLCRASSLSCGRVITTVYLNELSRLHNTGGCSCKQALLRCVYHPHKLFNTS